MLRKVTSRSVHSMMITALTRTLTLIRSLFIVKMTFVPFLQTTTCCIHSGRRERGYTPDTKFASPGGKRGRSWESSIFMFTVTFWRGSGCCTYMENLVKGVLHVLTTQQGVFQFGGRDVAFPDERHHQNVFLQQHHLRTGNLGLLHPYLSIRTFINMDFVWVVRNSFWFWIIT